MKEPISIEIEDDASFRPTAAVRKFEPSEYQAAIFRFIEEGTGDAIVNAVAGSGKTTTLVEASKLLPPSTSSIFCAFNAHIVKELTSRLQGMECKTIHSIGLSTLAQHFGWQPKVGGNKYRDLCRKESWKLADEIPNVSRTQLASSLLELVEYVQATLAFAPYWSEEEANERGLQNVIAALSSLVSHFGLSLPCPVEKLAPYVNSALRQGLLDAKSTATISFSDMLWLPWIWNLTPRTYDWVFVDECQDLNRAQLEMVLKLRKRIRSAPYVEYLTETERELRTLSKPTGRMIFVGDPRQAIYGFSGADAASYQNIKQRTSATEFPLSISYRCPVLVIREAQRIVPGIQARQDAPLGTVRWINESELYSNVKEGDLLLCRVTAPLISTCLDLIQQRIPARVRGKDLGKMLTRTVQIVSERREFTFSDFPRHLHEHTVEIAEKLRRKPNNEAAVEKALDTEAALHACFVGYQKPGFLFGNNRDETNAFKFFIESLFSDDRPGVYLSTVHRAKGLEAERVFILKPQKLPLKWKGQQPWEAEQELNLQYVAITRAIDELIYVKSAER